LTICWLIWIRRWQPFKLRLHLQALAENTADLPLNSQHVSRF
jgi:hypothetical protein